MKINIAISVQYSASIAVTKTQNIHREDEGASPPATPQIYFSAGAREKTLNFFKVHFKK